MADRETRDRVALLLRRAGFGASPDELERYVGLGVDGTLDELLHPERVEEDFDGLLASLSGHLIDLQNIEDVQTWWLYRMVRTRRPLVEKLTLFWHGHFAVANAKVANPRAMHDHLALLREHGLGSYRDLLLGVSRDPAMLIWLDGNTNRKGAPNENYGRELLELFTLGIGNYAEADVAAAARAFTGWNLQDGDVLLQQEPARLRPEDVPRADRTARRRRHRGHRRRAAGDGRADLPQAVRLLRLPQPGAARPGDRWSATYLDSGYDIRAVVRAILRSDAFYSEQSRYGHVKSPVEFAVGAVRMLGGQARERGLIQALRADGPGRPQPAERRRLGRRARLDQPVDAAGAVQLRGSARSARGDPNDGGLVDPKKLLGADVRPDDGADGGRAALRAAGHPIRRRRPATPWWRTSRRRSPTRRS